MGPTYTTSTVEQLDHRLLETLVSMTKRKSFWRISQIELLQQANIEKHVFLKNYKNKLDFLNKINQRVVNTLMETIPFVRQKKDFEDFKQSLNILINDAACMAFLKNIVTINSSSTKIPSFVAIEERMQQAFDSRLKHMKGKTSADTYAVSDTLGELITSTLVFSLTTNHLNTFKLLVQLLDSFSWVYS